MQADRLVEIPIKDWPNLRDLYESRKNESNSYNLLQNYINWLKIDPSIDFAKFYSLNGDWSDGTYVLLESSYYVMFNTRNDQQDRLLAALNCLDASCEYNFCGFPERLKPTVERYLSQFGIKIDSSNISPTIWYNIPQAEALQFDVNPPEGITLSKLSQDNVETINSIWPHRHPGSERFVSRLIALNENVGAYDKDGNLVAWCLILPIGALGLLHVKDGQKRKGYGSLVTRVLSRKLAEQGTEVIAPVVVNNLASRNMFKKLGFQEVDEVNWLMKPKA